MKISEVFEFSNFALKLLTKTQFLKNSYTFQLLSQYQKSGVYLFNSFLPNAPFIYPLKTSENLTVFWCFQEVEYGCIGNEWVKNLYNQHLVFCEFQFKTSDLVTKLLIIEIAMWNCIRVLLRFYAKYADIKSHKSLQRRMEWQAQVHTLEKNLVGNVFKWWWINMKWCLTKSNALEIQTLHKNGANS